MAIKASIGNPPMLVLLGALKQEISGLQSRMILEESFAQQGCRIYRGKYRNRDVLLVQTGVGKERAERATKLVLERYPVKALISLGFAGALTAESKVGDVILCSTLYRGNGQVRRTQDSEDACHSDASLVSLAAQTLLSNRLRWIEGSIVTMSQPVSEPRARYELGETFSANVVDTESYWISRVASARQVAFLSIRAISDTVEDVLLPFDRFMELNGSWRWRRAAPYFFMHPQKLVRLFHFYRNAVQARKSLTDCIDCLIARLGDISGKL